MCPGGSNTPQVSIGNRLKGTHEKSGEWYGLTTTITDLDTRRTVTYSYRGKIPGLKGSWDCNSAPPEEPSKYID